MGDANEEVACQTVPAADLLVYLRPPAHDSRLAVVAILQRSFQSGRPIRSTGQSYSLHLSRAEESKEVKLPNSSNVSTGRCLEGHL